MKDRISLVLRGQEVEIELKITAPDPDVGMTGPGWEDESIFDENGKILDWTLTAKETDQVSLAVCDHYHDGEHYFEDDSYIP